MWGQLYVTRALWCLKDHASVLLGVFVWILLSSVQVHKCQQLLIKGTKCTEAVEHQDLEALTGGIVQKTVRYLKAGKLYIMNTKNDENNLKHFNVAAC